MILAAFLTLRLAGATFAVTCEPAAGWMREGWGGYRIEVRNQGPGPLDLRGYDMQWVDPAGKRLAGPWRTEWATTLAPGGVATRRDVGYFVAEAVPNGADRGRLRLTFDTDAGPITRDLEVPVAQLPERLKRLSGKHVALELQPSAIRRWRTSARTLRWLDEAYDRMLDLTGRAPFAGRPVVIRESPEHPYWAYAGEPIVMNTRYVPEQIAKTDRGLIPFGWVHEMGHVFDVLGDWYLWNGPAAEWQANFKLAYAAETMRSQDYRVDMGRYSGHAYRPEPGDALRTGREFVDGFFVPFGDRYLADPSRGWRTLSSDEIHSFFQRLQRVYGWEVFRRWYRAYGALADAKRPVPSTPEDKIRLICAILSRETGVDQTPNFELWRFPLDAAEVARVAEVYGIALPRG